MLWLAWVRRRRLRHVRPTQFWIGPSLVAVGGLLYVVGNAQLLEVLWHGGAVIVALGCALTVIGGNAARAFFPVLFVLAFLIPVPGTLRQQIALPLQTVAAVTSEQALTILGLPVDRAGNLLSINGERVTIAEACNGLRMGFALTLVSFAIAFGMPLRNYVRAILIVLSPITAIVCNVVRLIPTVWFYGYADQNIAKTFHDWAGWTTLLIGLVLLFGVIETLRWGMLPVHRFTLATR
jgi:exosortase